MTSNYRIQNIVTISSSRKATKCNSCLFPSCVTQKSGLCMFPKGEFSWLVALSIIFDLDPLDL
ncbi:hypothetical protein CTM83_10630 [Photobacterium leiognathi subsp. mandapamensis]|nr:hypothetical protein CTM83_10630 [Photobacterium leiognathi subsp. mandapamensis]